MTPLVEYQCDICLRKYPNYVDALRCEGRGYPDKSVLPPLGTIICTPPNDRLYPNFAWVVSYIGSDIYYKHDLKLLVTVFRGNDVGDDDLASAMNNGGRDTFNHIMHDITKPTYQAYDCPAFRRAVQAVRDLNMIPRVTKFGKVITLEEANLDV